MNELDFYFVSKHFPLPRNNESKPRKKSLLQRVDASFRKTLLPVGVSPDGAAWNDKAVEAVAEINQFVQKAIEESAARGIPRVHDGSLSSHDDKEVNTVGEDDGEYNGEDELDVQAVGGHGPSAAALLAVEVKREQRNSCSSVRCRRRVG